MKADEIKAGKSYTGARWKGDRKVQTIERAGKQQVVNFVDLRTGRTGRSPLDVFAASASGPGQVANI